MFVTRQLRPPRVCHVTSMTRDTKHDRVKKSSLVTRVTRDLLALNSEMGDFDQAKRLLTYLLTYLLAYLLDYLLTRYRQEWATLTKPSALHPKHAAAGKEHAHMPYNLRKGRLRVLHLCNSLSFLTTRTTHSCCS